MWRPGLSLLAVHYPIAEFDLFNTFKLKNVLIRVFFRAFPLDFEKFTGYILRPKNESILNVESFVPH